MGSASNVERYRLTTKQSKVLALIGRGLRSKQIGDRMGISHRTAEAHR